MSFRRIVSTIAVASTIAAVSASAQAQYYYRHHYYHHPYRAAAFYNAQNYLAVPSVLPPTYIGPNIEGIYAGDAWWSEYGCCGSSRNNERIGLVGAGGFAR